MNAQLTLEKGKKKSTWNGACSPPSARLFKKATDAAREKVGLQHDINNCHHISSFVRKFDDKIAIVPSTYLFLRKQMISLRDGTFLNNFIFFVVSQSNSVSSISLFLKIGWSSIEYSLTRVVSSRKICMYTAAIVDAIVATFINKEDHK